jgi:putative NADPH-quinone reductase
MHGLRRIDVARLDFPILRTKAEFERAASVPDIRDAQHAILWADHLLILYPLWLGTMPALLKAFLEHVLRPGFAFDESSRLPRKLLKGRAARIVVTMGMPAFLYRWYFGARGLRSLERNVLGFCGIRPIRASLIGMVEAGGDARRAKWLDRLHALGRRGADARAQGPALPGTWRANKTVLQKSQLA